MSPENQSETALPAAPAAARFHDLLCQYGPPPEPPESLLKTLERLIPRYALAFVGLMGALGVAAGLAFGWAAHAGPGLPALTGLGGIAFGLLTRERRWALAYIFGAALFSSRGLPPWACLWNALKHYPLAHATISEGFNVVKEQAAVERGSNLVRPTGRWWRRQGVRIEKRL
jgi:hypothetical protein